MTYYSYRIIDISMLHLAQTFQPQLSAFPTTQEVQVCISAISPS